MSLKYLTILMIVIGLCGPLAAQNTTDWTQPYDPDAGAVDLYHFYDGAIGAPQDMVDYAAPYIWGWTNNGSGAAPLNTASMTGFGDCISLDGMDDRGEVPPDASGNHNVYSDKITVEAWINPSNLEGIHRIVHMHGTISFYTEGANLRMWIFDNTGGNLWFPATTTNPLTVGEWTHVAGSYEYKPDGSATAKLYVNGDLKTAVNLAVAAPLGNARNVNWLMIGSTSWGSEQFEGKIDEVRISNVLREFQPLNPPNLSDWSKPFGPDFYTIFLFHTELDNGNPMFVVNSGPSQWGAWADPIVNDPNGSQRFATDVPAPEFNTSIYASGSTAGGAWPRWHALVNDVFAITPLENQLTLEAWIKPNNIPAEGGVIQRVISCNNCYFLYFVDDEIELWLKFADDSTVTFKTDGVNFPAGKWSHLAAIWDGPNNMICIIVDGNIVGTATFEPKPNLRTPTKDDWLVMCSPPWTAELYGGYIDEVRISRIVRYPTTAINDWALY